MKIEGQQVAATRVWIDDVLQVRVDRMGLKIEDLFLVVKSPLEEEGDTIINTRYGNLKVFFTNSVPEGKSFILHKSKFEYPSKNNPIKGLPTRAN
jgi:hypothetical protein